MHAACQNGGSAGSGGWRSARSRVHRCTLGGTASALMGAAPLQGGGTASARREPRRAGGVVAARAYIPVRTRYRGHPWPLLRRLRPTTSSGGVGVVAPVMPVPTGEHPSSLVRGPPTKERVETPWHWLLLAIPSRRAKPRPQRRPRTSCPGGRAQVAQGCATTRVRTGRPVEGCALPPGHGGPVRSWHYRREYRPVRRSPVTGLLAVRPGVPGHAAWASCSDTGAPGPRPAFRGHGFCAGTPPWARDAAVRFEGGLQPMVWRFPPAAGAPARGLKDAVRVATAPRAGLTPTSVAPARRPGVPAAGG